MLSKNQILEQLDKIKIEEVPQELIDQEIHVLTHGMKEEEIKKNRIKYNFFIIMLIYFLLF